MAYFDKYGVEFSDDRKTLVRCPDNFEGAYAIPDGIELIAGDAFKSCKGLTSLVIPNSVKEIGNGAFQGCSYLTSVTISNNITSIGNLCFGSCTSLTSIEIPSSVTYIGDVAFLNCKSLTSVVIPNSVTEIGTCVFESCPSLNAPLYNAHVFAYMPKTYSGAYAIPNGIKSIADGAFEGCKDLTSVVIPNSVTKIGISAFEGCTYLTAPLYNAHVFAYMPKTYSGAYVILDGIKSIAGGAFKGCKGLTSVVIPDSVAIIGDGAFNGCNSLTAVKIGDNVTCIDYWAFFDCSSLTSITLPNSVSSIREDAFSGCANLKEIFVSTGQKTRFAQMEGLKELTNLIVERDNEELTILLNLAQAYERGIGVAQSVTQAFLIYNQAAEKGSAESAYRLAEWYVSGEVVPRDLNKALVNYQIAAKYNYKDAIDKVNEIQNEVEQPARMETEKSVNIQIQNEQENSGNGYQEDDPERFTYSKAFELLSRLSSKMDDYFRIESDNGLFVGPAEEEDFIPFLNKDLEVLKHCNVKKNKALLDHNNYPSYSLYFYYLEDDYWSENIWKYNLAEDKWHICKVLDRGELPYL